ncbi:PAS domain S-box protein [Pricia sp. S334]|uniref:histidine kinase n=1 Tax=Pricia mediterranea TaxID=3076079 RepID=A0ABU3L616_9FLAO|nr:PAS domain S-box protein [Pricia sp. S334]MDT7828683.1 PAS domain S-box protein [Pricia sp. S334]
MQTLSIDFIIRDSPTAVAVLDSNLCFIKHSAIWHRDFASDFDAIIGRYYYDILPDTPDFLRELYSNCLRGASNSNPGKKFVSVNGTVTWLSWKIKPWRDDDDTIKGLIIVLEDVTEIKRKEELLLTSQKVAKTGAWEVDLLSDRVYWTPITKEIHQVPESYEPTLETGINFYKKGLHRNTITRFVTDAMNDGTPWDAEFILVTARGNEVWVRAKGEVEIVDGRPTRLYGTFQDIDEKKKAELKFIETSERLAIATKGAKIGIWDYDFATRKLICDENMFKLYGVDESSCNDRYAELFSVLHPEDRESAYRAWKIAVSGLKEFDTEFRIVRPDGKIRHLKALGVVQMDAEGRALKITGTNWDITALKKTQMLLKNSEESFTGAFESSSIGMALVGLKGQWMKVNQSLCNSLGYEEKKLMQMTFQQITHKEDLEKDLHLLQELLDGKRDSYQIDKRYYHKSGKIVHVILSVTGVRKINGELSHFISQIMDISPRIIAEKELTRLVEVTSEQNESLLNFAHIVSHNLRSHSSNLSMLSGFLNTETDEGERTNLVEMLHDASESLSETVVHLNEVVQVKINVHDKMKPVNLYRTIKGVKKNLGLLLQEENAKLHIEIDKNLVVNGISAYLDSIFLNLITNSIKYSSSDRPPVITIGSQKTNGKIIISFSDNGLGIDLKRHGDKLFGMYKTFHRNSEAKGIGLFITKNQIEAMNGKIEVESTVDVGTTFKLYFETEHSKV